MPRGPSGQRDDVAGAEIGKPLPQHSAQQAKGGQTGAVAGVVPRHRKGLQPLALGEDEARTMGISIKRMRFFVIICSTLIVSACVSISGQIGWVGLIIPHFAKMIVGSSYKYVIPASISIGALFLLLVDFFARVILPAEVPLGILTSLIGAPMFIILLLKGAKQET